MTVRRPCDQPSCVRVSAEVMASDGLSSTQAMYERVCESYHAVDDFRMKLLGLLPVATGTGVFLLLNSNTDLLGPGQAATQQRQTLEHFLIAIGGFGFLFTLGLFAYELFGIKKCHYLIETGTRLEFSLKVEGQFRSRPPNLLRVVNEPFASALIYPASLAAWTFLAFAYSTSSWRWWLPATVFAGGLAFTVAVAIWIKHGAENAFRDEVHAEVERRLTTTVGRISQALNADPARVQRAIDKLSAQADDLTANHDTVRFTPRQSSISMRS